MTKFARAKRDTEHGTVLMVFRLLARGLPKTVIAKQLKIGRMTVYRLAARFASGYRPHQARCPKCGGLLEIEPCMACELRSELAKGTRDA